MLLVTAMGCPSRIGNSKVLALRCISDNSGRRTRCVLTTSMIVRCFRLVFVDQYTVRLVGEQIKHGGQLGGATRTGHPVTSQYESGGNKLALRPRQKNGDRNLSALIALRRRWSVLHWRLQGRSRPRSARSSHSAKRLRLGRHDRIPLVGASRRNSQEHTGSS